MGVRRNVLQDATARRQFVEGCVQLSSEMTGITSTQANTILAPQVPGWSMRGVEVDLSWWDLFVLWHYVAMQLPTPGGANRAHGGPVFLPWHRMFMIRLEETIQTRTNNPNFGLPYWDWARDRTLSSALWRSGNLGSNRGAVTTGPIGALRVRLTESWSETTGSFLESHAPRPITRNAGQDTRALPTKTQVRACLAEADYDRAPWDMNAAGFRNRLEGWRPQAPGLHNLVHVWVGGDMSPGTSPNDPVFYLNHCNVDRIWEAKMVRSGRTYRPSSGGPSGHNLNDPMVSLIGAAMTPAGVLDVSAWYTYDNLNVET